MEKCRTYENSHRTKMLREEEKRKWHASGGTKHRLTSAQSAQNATVTYQIQDFDSDMTVVNGRAGRARRVQGTPSKRLEEKGEVRL